MEEEDAEYQEGTESSKREKQGGTMDRGKEKENKREKCPQQKIMNGSSQTQRKSA